MEYVESSHITASSFVSGDTTGLFNGSLTRRETVPCPPTRSPFWKTPPPLSLSFRFLSCSNASSSVVGEISSGVVRRCIRLTDYPGALFGLDGSRASFVAKYYTHDTCALLFQADRLSFTAFRISNLFIS